MPDTIALDVRGAADRLAALLESRGHRVANLHGDLADQYRHNHRRHLACARRWRERGERRAAALYLAKVAHHRRQLAAMLAPFPRPRGAE